MHLIIIFYDVFPRAWLCDSIVVNTKYKKIPTIYVNEYESTEALITILCIDKRDCFEKSHTTASNIKLCSDIYVHRKGHKQQFMICE